MKEQDKELLLKDLCARLHYGVKVQIKANLCYDSINTLNLDDLKSFIENSPRDEDWYDIVTSIKPYLRLMLSMTDEEAIEFVSLYGVEDFLKVNVKQECLEIIIDDRLSSTTVMKLWYEDIHLPVECFDFLLRNHFDFRNLIPMGLALTAPEGMYNF